MKQQSILYYAGRVLQRALLCTVVGATIIYWSILIATASSIQHISALESAEIAYPQELNRLIQSAVNQQSMSVMRWAILAAAVTFLLLVVKRYKKHDKALVVDSVVIILFCVVSTILAQSIIRYFIAHL